jgi:acetylornithine/succinyldiaminopimelate/putrescine aminotransferase
MYPMMLEMERADGIYIYDTNGKKYIDLISGIGVSSLGHGNTSIKNAIINQVEKHMHLMVYGEYIQSPQVLCAQAICSLLPAALNSVYFTNSGAEATEGALKLAKRVTGRKKIIACKNAYHGSTHGPLSLNSHSYFTDKFQPLLQGVSFIEYNNFDDLNSIDEQTACVVIEAVQGEAGYIAAAPYYLEMVREKCTEAGALLIIDEVQSGFGRTGTYFAFQQYQCLPDIVLMGKALGAGLPLGAFVSSRQHMITLADNPYLGHITTFGGNPVCCAASLAFVKELKSLNLTNTVSEKEQLIRNLLVHPHIKSISGKGLMLAVELSSNQMVMQIISLCLEDGLITDWFLFAGNKLRISPPLTITLQEIELACSIILKNLQKI